MISDDFQIGPNGAYEHVGNQLDIQYQDLLQHILDNGVEKKDRTGTGTLSVFGHQIRHNMQDGFPLLTTKKMAWKTMVTELLWFLRGDTNIKFLVDNNCHIWDGDAYKRYSSYVKEEWESGAINELFEDDLIVEESNDDKNISYRKLTKEEFINKIKTDDRFANKWGELGPIYGQMWRDWDSDTGVKIDQIKNLINDLKSNPDSRRLMVNAWNPTYIPHCVLPPCHYSFQVYTRELHTKERWEWYSKHGGPNGEVKLIAMMVCENEEDNSHIKSWLKKWAPNVPTRAISLMWNQRSVDTFLGLPFNIASYGLLLELIAKAVNMVPDELIGNLGDVHLYSNHIEQAKEQISRTPYELPKLNINTEFWPTENGSCGEGPLDAIAVFNSFKKDDFCKCLLEEDIQLGNYQSHPAIKAPLSN